MASMMVECLNVEGKALEQSNNARRSVTSIIVKYSAVGVIFDGSINDSRRLKRRCWRVACLKTEEKILKHSINDCGWQALSVRTQFL